MQLLQSWTKSALLEVQEYVLMVWKSGRALVTRPFYFRDVVEQFDAIGVGSLLKFLRLSTMPEWFSIAVVSHPEIAAKSSSSLMRAFSM